MKLFVLVSSLDLRQPLSATPSWWQLLKALYEVGVEVIAAPYHGPAIESLWWQAYPNPCQTEGRIFETVRRTLRSVRGAGSDPDSAQAAANGLGPADKMVRQMAQVWVRPRWQTHLGRLFSRVPDIDAILILTVPLNHLVGLPRFLRERYGLPVIYYDGDVPASLPAAAGFATGFKIYPGADLDEYDLFLSNSKGGLKTLKALGARHARELYYAADPDLFAPVTATPDIDVFFYGHSSEYRRDWLNWMLSEPSRRLPERRFAVRGQKLGIDLNQVTVLPYASFSKLREYCSRSRVNLNITRQTHAETYASSTARIFELAALGCCLVSNPLAGVEEWFEPERELVMLSEPGEVIERYTWLLDHETVRQRLGYAARERVLKEHTFRHRARQLVGYIEEIARR
jgi:glycosyltransferase involved in cell wall biosynthesis